MALRSPTATLPTLGPRVALALLTCLAVALVAAVPDRADARSFKRCGPVKKATKRFKVKKPRITRPHRCRTARNVARRWVKTRYDQNAIASGGTIWFCTWKRRAPQSLVTGTAECDAGADDEIRFSVRRR